jgi:3-hydroxyisobutyrate dehydrogenase
MTSTVGFVGLGLMGQGFTKRLIARGFKVVGYDVAPAKIAAAKAYGVAAAGSSVEVARASEIVCLSVMSASGTHAVEEAVLGADGIASVPGTGKVLVDLSTTTIEETRHCAAELGRRTGMAWVDAPVSGGPGAAEAGQLAIMAGGDAEALARVRPVLEQFASRLTHMGPLGAGQATKMINQVIVLTNFCVLAEALRLGETCGVDVARMPEALATGYAGSLLLNDLFPRMIARDFAPRGLVRQILKDLDMVHDLAKQRVVPTPMTSLAASLFRTASARGWDELDGTAVLKLYLDGT